MDHSPESAIAHGTLVHRCARSGTDAPVRAALTALAFVPPASSRPHQCHHGHIIPQFGPLVPFSVIGMRLKFTMTIFSRPGVLPCRKADTGQCSFCSAAMRLLQQCYVPSQQPSSFQTFVWARVSAPE